jgi:hypothetical protein
MPFPLELVAMFDNDLFEFTQLGGRHAIIISQLNRPKPVFAFVLRPANVHVKWFIPLVAVEMKAKSLVTKYRGHLLSNR